MIERLPNPQGPMVDRAGIPAPEWHDYFRELGGVPDDLQAQIDALAVLIAALQEGGSSPGVVSGAGSINTFGSLADGEVWVRLDNDVDEPGDAKFYGTSPTGAKGWFSRLLATLADVDLTGLTDGDVIGWDSTAAKFVPAGAGAVPTYIAPDKTFRVREYTQALFSMPIDAEGILDVEGFLIGVD